MREITVLSGKGGTGKTTITAALASLAKNTVFTDCDVDAADLHLLLQPDIYERHAFESGTKAIIDTVSCNGCGICEVACRFDAISKLKGDTYHVNAFKCEGCRLCERICPVDAITSVPSMNNFWYVSNTRFGKLVHAHMGPGEENSGKLVSVVRKKAKEIAQQENSDIIINDGPPGIGCPVIASLTGVGRVIMVIEPTKSGLHDASRLVELTKKFGIKTFAIINKSDLHSGISDLIETELFKLNIDLLGKIPFDDDFIKAMISGKTIVEYAPDSRSAILLNQFWKRIMMD
nr:4Fe-4S binding protein [Bacteroidota bacterium]